MKATPVSFVVLLLSTLACTELSSPTRWYMRCYDTVQVAVTSERIEDAYCWVRLQAPFQFCSVGDTVDVMRLDITRPECVFLAPNQIPSRWDRGRTWRWW